MIYARIYKNFKSFLDDDEHLTQEEQDRALTAFKNPLNKRLFNQCIILLLWTFVALFVDLTIIGGSVTAAVLQGPGWIYLLPTIIFSAINWIIKSIFVYFYMQRKIPFSIAFITGVQYIGFTLLLGYVLKKDPELKHGLAHYLRYLRSQGILNLLRLVKKIKYPKGGYFIMP